VNTAPQDALQEAMAHARAGDTGQANEILAVHLRRQPRDARAWFLLSYTLDDPEKQLYALRRVLELDPDNRAARAELRRRTGGKAAVAARPAAILPAARPPAARPVLAKMPLRRAGAWASPSLIAGVIIVLILALVALAAPLIAPPVEGEPTGIIPRYGVSPMPTAPSAAHPLGLLPKQYDVLYGLVWGARRAFAAGLLVTVGRLLFGVLLGLVAGYAGGWLDGLLMRITDSFLSFPIMAAAMVMVSLYGVELYVDPGGIALLMPAREESIVMAALVIFGWMSYARLIRGNMLAEREKEYIEAARAAGIRPARIVLRHLLPNVVEGLFVMAASDVGAVVVLLATFAFLGLFSSPLGLMEADWGQMLTAGRNWIINASGGILHYWYTFLPVSAAIILFSLGWNLVGDGLRDTLDPYQY
jgi:peptide/nickel transport system permease protein